mmetsp:Transcript_1842/g.3311  ORF Transcript_1842/g.3311 Transcript_1842/m.3311 type:complete len:1155 (+) Transcript_1842:438-3902(+)
MQLPQPRGDLAHHSFAMNEAGYDSVAQAGMPANYDMIPDPAEAYSRRGNHALPDPMHELTLPGENFAEAMYQNDQDTLIYRRPHPDYRRTPSQGPVVVPLHSLAPSPHMSGRLNDEQSTLVPTSLNEPQGFSMAFRDSSEEVYATSSRAASAPILGGRSTGDGGTGGPIRQNTMEMMTAPRHGPVGTQGGINGTGGMRGSFENSIFKPRYQRNNKRGGLKNLRCFPSCGFRHKEKGFCGRSVEIDLSHPPETSSSRFNTWVEFVRTDEPPRYHLGERVSMDVLLDLERSKDEPIKPLVRGERLDEKCTESSTSFEFNRERRGWHYGWASNKHTCNAQHTLQCYIFEASEHDPNEHVCKLIVRSPSFMLFCRRRRRFTLMPSAPTSAPTKRARSAASANEHAATVKRERLERNDDEDFGNDEDVEDGDEEENVALVTSSTSLSSSLVDSGNVGRLNPQNPADASSSSSSTSSTPLSHQSQGHQHQYPQPSSRGGPSKLPSGKKYHAPTALASSSSSSSLTPQVSPVQSSMQGVVHSQSVPSMPPKVAAQKLPNHSNRSRESQGSTYTAGSIRLGGIGMADSSRAESVFKRLAVIMSRIQQQQQQQQQGSTNAVSVAGSNEVTSPHKPVMSSQAGHGSPGQRSDPVPMHLGNPNSLGDINFHDVDDILDFEGNGDGLSEDEGVGSSDNEAMSRDTFPTGNEQQINSNNNVSNGNFAHPGSNQLYVNTQGNNGSEQVPNPSSARSIGSTSASQSEASSTPTGKKPSLEDFEMVRVLGKGSFGKVLLCRKRDSGKLYAIKVLKKQHVVKRRQVVHTKTERSVLGLVDHPFVVKLHYAFQTGDKLHFVLDFCSGGELFFHLGRAGRFSENLGRFYAAEIALALGHLHKKGVVYRDLKPENILLDSEGHIKLADFGLSKEGIVSGIKGTHSFCGTPEYLAPEVLNRKGHGTSVDWWSLGALLYEMLTGLPPWYSQDRQKMFACIRSSDLRFPDFVSSLAQLILTDFLERDVTKRLGSVRDVDDVKEHPFFQFMDWDKLYRREIPSPFVPRLNSQTDTANFDTQFTRLPINSIDASSFVGSPRNPHMLSSSVMSESQTHFDNFTYAEPSTLSANMQEIGSLQGGHMAYQPQVHVGSLAATSHSPAMNGLSNNGLSGGLLFD